MADSDPVTSGFDSELSIQAASATTWRLTSPLIWTGTQGDTFIVPLGFVTDFATVPRFLHWLVLPYGAYTRAAVLHDWLLVELATWSLATDYGRAVPSDMPPEPPANSRDTDGVFRRVMQELGVPWAKRWIMWAAVRIASVFSAERAYGRQFWRDAHQVFGIGLLVAPVILPGAIGVLISLGLVRIINLAMRPFSK